MAHATFVLGERLAWLSRHTAYRFRAQLQGTWLGQERDAVTHHLWPHECPTHLHHKLYQLPQGSRVCRYLWYLDIMAGSLFTIECALSLHPRAKIKSVLISPWLVSIMATCYYDKLENSLLPFFADLASSSEGPRFALLWPKPTGDGPRFALSLEVCLSLYTWIWSMT